MSSEGVFDDQEGCFSPRDIQKLDEEEQPVENYRHEYDDGKF